MKTLTVRLPNQLLFEEDGVADYPTYRVSVPADLSDEIYQLIAYGLLAKHDWSVNGEEIDWWVR